MKYFIIYASKYSHEWVLLYPFVRRNLGTRVTYPTFPLENYPKRNSRGPKEISVGHGFPFYSKCLNRYIVLRSGIQFWNRSDFHFINESLFFVLDYFPIGVLYFTVCHSSRDNTLRERFNKINYDKLRIRRTCWVSPGHV